MLFQSISILSAVAAVYLFGEKAVDLFALGLCLVNGFIMLLEIPNFGLAESITSLVTCLVTFGDAVGYARNLEIHDLTFVFGQLVLYYAAFAPKNTRKETADTAILTLRLPLFLSCQAGSALPSCGCTVSRFRTCISPEKENDPSFLPLSAFYGSLSFFSTFTAYGPAPYPRLWESSAST